MKKTLFKIVKNKELMLLLVSVVLNGILIFIFQTTVQQCVNDNNREIEIEHNVMEEFWEKSGDLNNALIEMNVEVMEDPDMLLPLLKNIRKKVIYIQQYYDTNIYDLKVFDVELQNLIYEWDEFANIIGDTNELWTDEKRFELGEALQDVKDSNLKLRAAIREKL